MKQKKCGNMYISAKAAATAHSKGFYYMGKLKDYIRPTGQFSSTFVKEMRCRGLKKEIVMSGPGMGSFPHLYIVPIKRKR